MGQKPTASKHSEPLSLSFPSLYAFFKDMSFLGLILLLAFMCENYPIHPQGGKTWDRDMYWFLCLLLLIWSIATMKKVGSGDGGDGGSVATGERGPHWLPARHTSQADGRRM